MVFYFEIVDLKTLMIFFGDLFLLSCWYTDLNLNLSSNLSTTTVDDSAIGLFIFTAVIAVIENREKSDVKRRSIQIVKHSTKGS